MSDRWAPIRQRAAAARAEVRAATGGEGRPLIEQALQDLGLFVMARPAEDPLLHGCRAVVNGYYVAYDGALALQQANFALAHELGHLVMHHLALGHVDEADGAAAAWYCTTQDIDESAAPQALRFGAGSVEVYNPRQQRELEANVFAMAFLLPPDELRTRFVAGESYRQIATHFRVSPAAALNAMATVLLSPTGLSDSHLAPQTDSASSEAEPDLDASQLAAATVDAGPVLVNAGPGTGKTRTLVARVTHLVGERGVLAGRILAVTFSNRATEELRQRLLRAVPAPAHQLTISTFHAFCLERLRRYHAAAGLPPDFRVIDDVDAVLLLERHLATLDLDAYLNVVYPEFALQDLVAAISRAKDELATPEHYAALAAAGLRVAEASGDEDRLRDARKSVEVARVYAVYERLLAQRGAIDFGGLVMRMARLLSQRPDVLAQVQAEFAHILVDEYQDMNRASARLLRHVAGDGRGLWVVGDVRQSIYQFRGAAPRNMTGFALDFPGGRSIDLAVNYRSDPALVALLGAAGRALAVDGAAAGEWHAAAPARSGPHVWVGNADDGVAEARGIAAEVRRRHDAGRPFREQAILVRTHGHAEALVQALEAADVPALYVGDLFAVREVRDLLALLALVADGDAGGLQRLAQTAEYGLTRDEVLRLVRTAREAERDFPAALDLAGEAGLSAPGRAACAALEQALAAVQRETDPWQLLARFLFGTGALVRRLLADRRPMAAQRLLAIGQFLAVARAFAAQASAGGAPRATVAGSAQETDPGVGSARDSGGAQDAQDAEDEEASERAGGALRRFLGYVRRLVALGENGVRTPLGGEDLDAVRVLTVHASKGLEFPVVYVPCLVQRRFPLQRQADAAPPLEGLSDSGMTVAELHHLGEQCLFFVALSRAKEELILSWAGKYDSTIYKATPFLDLLAPFFAVHPPVELRWPAAVAPTAGGARSAGAASRVKRTVHIWDVELYISCPRRYEYQKLLHLEEHQERQGYKRFHDCVHAVLKELRHARPTIGGAAHTAPAAQEVLARLWASEGPRGHAYEALYRALAERLVARYCESLKGRPLAQEWRSFVDVPLGGAIVRVQIDDSELTSEGTVRLVRRHTGKKSDDHRTAERLALLRSGATQLLKNGESPQGGAAVSIELEYVGSGETHVVPHVGRYEQPRVDALERAVQGILDGDFPARPKKAGSCATCPFWIVCPS